MSNAIKRVVRPTSGGAPVFCTIPSFNLLNLLGNQLSTIVGTVFTALNNVPTSPNVAVAVSADTFSSSSDTVHFEQYFDAEAQASNTNSFTMALTDTVPATGNPAETIAGYQLRPNTLSPNTGILLDSIGGGPLITGMNVIAGVYKCAVDINTNAQTVQFKDSLANSVALGVKVSSWNTTPIVNIFGSFAGDNLNDSIETTFNPGTEADQLPTVGSVRPCEAS